MHYCNTIDSPLKWTSFCWDLTWCHAMNLLIVMLSQQLIRVLLTSHIVQFSETFCVRHLQSVRALFRLADRFEHAAKVLIVFPIGIQWKRWQCDIVEFGRKPGWMTQNLAIDHRAPISWCIGGSKWIQKSSIERLVDQNAVKKWEFRDS
jgi:hypothetical protein